jgi:hypothetical protein
LVAAERIAEGRREWDSVWERYRSSWRSFPKVIEQLQLASLPVHQDLFTDLSRYPKANDEAEEKLRAALGGLVGASQTDAVARLQALEQEHGARRQWLWAEMGQAPLSQALEPLSRLVVLVGKPFGGQHLADMADAYRGEFWQADAAARQALEGRLRTKANTEAVSAALQAVYVPWLDEVNRRFQGLVRKDGYPGSTVVEEPSGTYQASGECWLFVDGLRYDVAQDLAAALKEGGWNPPSTSTGRRRRR